MNTTDLMSDAVLFCALHSVNEWAKGSYWYPEDLPTIEATSLALATTLEIRGYPILFCPINHAGSMNPINLYYNERNKK